MKKLSNMKLGAICSNAHVRRLPHIDLLSANKKMKTQFLLALNLTLDQNLVNITIKWPKVGSSGASDITNVPFSFFFV